jgi:hypothetical protein
MYVDNVCTVTDMALFPIFLFRLKNMFLFLTWSQNIFLNDANIWELMEVG